MKRLTVQKPQGSRRGAMLPLVAICLPLILIFAAYSVNVAHMQLVRTELRTATDAAARAGSRTLSLTQSTGKAESAALKAAEKNYVAGEKLKLRKTDLVWGFSRPDGPGRWEFEAVNDPKNDPKRVGE